MPAPHRQFSVADAFRNVEESCLTTLCIGQVGLEIEWLVWDSTALSPVEVPVSRLADALTGVPGLRGQVSFEPGGQVEISSPPLPGADPACGAVEADFGLLADPMRTEGLALLGLGLDPTGGRPRVVRKSRYNAMEAYFDAQGSGGRTMMRSTAAVQVNLDAGLRSTLAARWSLAGALGPMLAAAFANSPLQEGAPSGWKSTRLAIWQSIDPSRTAPVAGSDPLEAWARYALQAGVMLVQVSEGHFIPMPCGFPFQRWIEEGHELGFPTEEDFAYHLTTLFPPIRPKAWLELRMLDALPAPWWPVAVAVCTCLMDDEEAAARAAFATAGCRGQWIAAARQGLSHPHLAKAARECFEAALEAQPRAGASPDTVAAVADYYDRFVARGRCPADDVLDAWAAGESPNAAWQPEPVAV
jgi:glutamate--cysteine ligase